MTVALAESCDLGLEVEVAAGEAFQACEGGGPSEHRPDEAEQARALVAATAAGEADRYDSSDTTLAYHHWQDKSSRSGEQFIGDIANA